jgi:hypothetical protein
MKQAFAYLGQSSPRRLAPGCKQPETDIRQNRMRPAVRGDVNAVLPIFLVPLYLSLSSGVRQQ